MPRPRLHLDDLLSFGDIMGVSEDAHQSPTFAKQLGSPKARGLDQIAGSGNGSRRHTPSRLHDSPAKPFPSKSPLQPNSLHSSPAKPLPSKSPLLPLSFARMRMQDDTCSPRDSIKSRGPGTPSSAATSSTCGSSVQLHTVVRRLGFDLQFDDRVLEIAEDKLYGRSNTPTRRLQYHEVVELVRQCGPLTVRQLVEAIAEQKDITLPSDWEDNTDEWYDVAGDDDICADGADRGTAASGGSVARFAAACHGGGSSSSQSHQHLFSGLMAGEGGGLSRQRRMAFGGAPTPRSAGMSGWGVGSSNDSDRSSQYSGGRSSGGGGSAGGSGSPYSAELFGPLADVCELPSATPARCIPSLNFNNLKAHLGAKLTARATQRATQRGKTRREVAREDALRESVFRSALPDLFSPHDLQSASSRQLSNSSRQATGGFSGRSMGDGSNLPLSVRSANSMTVYGEEVEESSGGGRKESPQSHRLPNGFWLGGESDCDSDDGRDGNPDDSGNSHGADEELVLCEHMWQIYERITATQRSPGSGAAANNSDSSGGSSAGQAAATIAALPQHPWGGRLDLSSPLQIAHTNYSSVSLVTFDHQPAVLKKLDVREAGHLSKAFSELAILEYLASWRRKYDFHIVVALLDYARVGDEVWLLLQPQQQDLQQWMRGQVADNGALPSGHITRVLRLFKFLVKLVRCLHEEQVAHGDLRLANLLMTGDDAAPLVLADFTEGLFVTTRTLLQGSRGTEEYQPPEMVLGNRTDPRSADVWALGCILYELVTGKLLFRARNECLRVLLTPAAASADQAVAVGETDSDEAGSDSGCDEVSIDSDKSDSERDGDMFRELSSDARPLFTAAPMPTTAAANSLCKTGASVSPAASSIAGGLCGVENRLPTVGRSERVAFEMAPLVVLPSAGDFISEPATASAACCWLERDGVLAVPTDRAEAAADRNGNDSGGSAPATTAAWLSDAECRAVMAAAATLAGGRGDGEVSGDAAQLAVGVEVLQLLGEVLVAEGPQQQQLRPSAAWLTARVDQVLTLCQESSGC